MLILQKRILYQSQNRARVYFVNVYTVSITGVGYKRVHCNNRMALTFSYSVIKIALRALFYKTNIRHVLFVSKLRNSIYVITFQIVKHI